MLTSDEIDGPVALNHQAHCVLLSLTRGERHGYGIMREVSSLTEGRVRLGPSGLYRAVKTLLVEGLVEECAAYVDPVLDEERRRHYRLTPKGRRIVALGAVCQVTHGVRSRHVQRVRSFACDAAKYGALGSHHAGIRTIPVSAIVGSVGRWQDLRIDFMPMYVPRSDERYRRVRQAMTAGTILPAIEVYQLDDRYYVLDGNHRVAAAKSLGHVEIDAVITEFRHAASPAPALTA